MAKQPTTVDPKEQLLSIRDFLDCISIDGLNKFVVQKIYAQNVQLKTASQWNEELKTIQGLSYIYHEPKAT